MSRGSKPPRYYVRTQPKDESHTDDYYDKNVKSKKQAFWWIDNKMTDAWEPVKIVDRKDGSVVKWFNEPKY